jgi:hypothetical protein
MHWSEPFGFIYRVMPARSWWLRVLIFVVGGGGFAALLGWEALRGQGPANNLAEAGLVGALVGLVFIMCLDGPSLMRNVTVSKDSVGHVGVAGWMVSMGSLHIDDIGFIRLIRPEELSRTYALRMTRSSRPCVTASWSLAPSSPEGVREAVPLQRRHLQKAGHEQLAHHPRGLQEAGGTERSVLPLHEPAPG